MEKSHVLECKLVELKYSTLKNIFAEQWLLGLCWDFAQLLRSWNHISPFLFPRPHCTLFHPITLLGTSWALFDPCAVFDPCWSQSIKWFFLQAGGAGSKEQQCVADLGLGWRATFG